MTIAERLDDIGKPAWIGLTVLSFLVWWPLGLVVLGYLVGSGRMACWTHGNARRWQRRMERMQAGGWRGGWYAGSSGDHAFYEYRTGNLRPVLEEDGDIQGFPQPFG